MNMSEVKLGAPYIYRTVNYGDIAVHVDGFSPNGQVAVLRIVGGEDSAPANRFPELSDGMAFAVEGQLFKRELPERKRAPRKSASLKRAALPEFSAEKAVTF